MVMQFVVWDKVGDFQQDHAMFATEFALALVVLLPFLEI